MLDKMYFWRDIQSLNLKLSDEWMNIFGSSSIEDFGRCFVLAKYEKRIRKDHVNIE